MIKKTTIAAAVLLAFAVPAAAETVSHETALAVAEGFIKPGRVGARILPDRSVASAAAWGSLWIVRLEPSGYVVVAGSDKCAPIVSFSPDDFAEPEAGSPLDVQLRGSGAWVERMEADESAGVDAAWAKLTASAAKKARLLAAAPAGTDGAGYDSFVAPFLGATWHQTAPYNDLAPYNYFCGCMATAAGQEIRYWRWPYRYEKFRTSTHGVRDALNNYHNFVVRPNGLVPFDWDKIKANYTGESNASTPRANDKQATYNAAYLSFWMQSLTGMGYKPGGSGGTRQLAASAEDYWYEKGVVMTYSNDGYDALWAAIKADLDWGSPIQINTAAHQMVIDGYAVENEGADDEVDYINLNLGYGNATYWTDLRTAVTSGTYSGVLAAFQTGYRPQKIVQFEPVPKVCGSDVTLTWHIAPCYTNRTTGFTLEISGGPTSVSAVNIPTHEETTTYTATGLEEGGEYTFTVTPVMVEGEGTGRPNSVTTTIGTPQPAPEIRSVSSVACGIELVQQDIFVECAMGRVNEIKVTCSESTTSLTNYSSHLTILPDEKISVVAGGTGSGSSEWIINVDATDMAQRWNVEGEMVVLTLVAKNADGTEACKNLMLRFNSMRNVMGGSFDIVEPNATGPVWFANGTSTTLDAKGQAVTFDATAFQGNGTVTLADSTGGGSFTFTNLDGFTGTLKWSEGLAVNLPSNMDGFSGTLSFDGYGTTYRLATSLPATAKVYIGGNTQLYIDNDATIDAAVTGSGYIMVVGSAPSFGNTKDFTGHFSLGTDTSPGTLTLNAGEEKNVAVDNGTVNLVLSKEQVAYGFETSAVALSEDASLFGLEVALVFLDEDGKQLAKWTSKLDSYAFAATANTWTPDSSTNYGNFGDTARWSFGRLPIAGEYVIFSDTSADGFGTEMKLNLSSDLAIEHIKVIGNTKFTISATDASSTLYVNKLENALRTTLNTPNIQPVAVVPNARLDMAEGITVDCEIDSSIAKNLYTPGGVSALPHASYWNGTVVFENRSIDYDLDPRYWGNEESKIRFNGAAGYVEQASHFTGGVVLEDDGTTPALHLTEGYNDDTVTIDKLEGDGTLKTSTKALSETFLLKDVSDFTGSLDLSTMNVAIADETPSANIGSDGRLHVCKAATVPAGKSWTAAGGLFLGANGALTVNGALAAKQIFTYGAGAALTLEDGATIDVQTAMGGASTPTLNFKAGTYKVENNVTETKTVNFCADAGTRTTLDANGHVVTLGTEFFSGSGDVHLTSSQSGGKFVLQGVGADFTGTIYADISAGVTLAGDVSQMGGRLNISDIILTVASSSIGNIDVGAGASLVVTVSKGDRIRGLAIDSVTLSDGATMVLQDADGNELATFEAKDAVDGKYILAPDATLEPTCVLDFEFNGNAASTGAETPTLSGGSYCEASALYTKSKPYITTDFTMPSDGWTAVVRGTLPAANGSTPTIVLMFGVNGGNLFGLMAGTDENTVALADNSGLIGEEVFVEDATTKFHVYTIVKTAGRVRLYVDGELKVNEAATISVKNRFQFGSVHGSNNTLYDACDDEASHIDFFKFYDFAVDESFEEMVYKGPKPIAVWTGDFDTTFDGCSLDWHGNEFADGVITIADGYQGVDVNLTSGTNAITVIVKYSGLSYSTSNGRVFFTSCADSNKTRDRTAVRLTTGNAVGGSHNSSTSSGTAASDYAATISAVPVASGYMVFSYGHPSDGNNQGTLVCTGSEEGSLNTTNYWNSGLKYGNDSTGNSIYGATIGGSRQETSTWKNAAGMKIEAIAVFTERLSSYERDDYRFPWPKVPVLTVSPASGAVEYGTDVTASCDDETATIWYKNYGDAEYTEYTGPISLTTSGLNYYYFHIKDANGNIVVADALFTYMVGDPPDVTPDDAVAQIDGGGYYASLQDAIDAASGDEADPSTVTLLKSSGEAVTLSGKKIVFAENGQSFSGTLSGDGKICVNAAPSTTSWNTNNFATAAGREWTGTFVVGWTLGGQIQIGRYGIAGSTIEVANAISSGYFNKVSDETGTAALGAPSVAPALYFDEDVTLSDGFANAGQITTFAKVGMASGKTFTTRGNAGDAQTYYAFAELEDFAGTLNVRGRDYVRIGSVNTSGMPVANTAIVAITKSANGDYSPAGDAVQTATGEDAATNPIDVRSTVEFGNNSFVYAGKAVFARINNVSGLYYAVANIDEDYYATYAAAVAAYTAGDTIRVINDRAGGVPDGWGIVGNAVVKKLAFVMTPENIDKLDPDEVGELPLVFRVAYTPDGSEAPVTNMYENILIIDGGRIALDPEGEVDGVVLRPEFDEDAARPYDAEGETITIKSIPGLWYSTLYGDALASGGIGGMTGETEPVQATGATLTLDAPKGGASRFYKVRVTPSPAASGDRQQMLSSRLQFSQEAGTGLQLLQNRGEEG